MRLSMPSLCTFSLKIERNLSSFVIYDNGMGRKVGAEGGHLKLELIQESHPYHHISAIAFNMASFFDHIKAGNPIDVCYYIVENYYRGTANTQLRIKDMHERDEMI